MSQLSLNEVHVYVLVAVHPLSLCILLQQFLSLVLNFFLFLSSLSLSLSLSLHTHTHFVFVHLHIQMLTPTHALLLVQLSGTQ